MPDFSSHVLDKSALYSGSRVFSAAGMAAAGGHACCTKNSCELPYVECRFIEHRS